MSINAKRELTEAYLSRTNTEPLVGFMVGSYYPLHRYAGARGLPQGLFTPGDLAPAAYLPDYPRLYAQHAACPGNLVWSASAFWGVPWLEACLGCPVEADHVTGSSRYHVLFAMAFSLLAISFACNLASEWIVVRSRKKARS